MSIHTITSQVGSTPIVFETGKMGKLADGAVTVRCGDTIVFVSAVSATSLKPGQDWFPLSVEYKEKASAAGRFPGGYFKREGRPTEKEIIVCRMTDRPLRPLFPKDYFFDTQIIALLLSADQVNDPDILSINGASAALCVSDIPFKGPIGAVRVGRINGQFVVNPTQEQRAHSDLDLIYVGTATEVAMIEGEASELPDEEFIKALQFAHEQIQPLIAAQEELKRLAGKAPRSYKPLTVRAELLAIAYSVAGTRIEDAIYRKSKVERNQTVGALKDEVKASILAAHPDATDFEVSQAFDYLQKKAFRVSILDRGARCDGRDNATIRPLSGEAGVLPRVHGSALFSRGETQALAIATLAPFDEKQNFDSYAGGEDSKSFILHYNFPPYSVGETGRVGGMNRREIGHGNLAERSIKALIPSEKDFPYAIRLVSEVMESNGSTSMASVCAGSMALFNAGVPMARPVAGISCGLVTEFDDAGVMVRYTTLLDIIGSEDHFGDMDFKLCGTTEGVTGYQLDLKLPGIPLSLLEEAIRKTRDARMKVIEVMNTAIATPAKQLSPYAPKIAVTSIPPDRIGELIGPGGKNIKALQAETGTDVSIQDDGTVHIYSTSQPGLDAALRKIRNMFAEIEIGTTYEGRVVSTTNFGAFMEVLPGRDGLIHVSELADFRVNHVEDVVKVGDIVAAVCVGVDEKGRVKMSRKAYLREQEKKAAAAAAAQAPAAPAPEAVAAPEAAAPEAAAPTQE